MRHYYDVYCLLQNSDILAFSSTKEYEAHKQKRFPKADNQVLSENEAFLLTDTETRNLYKKAYTQSASLYYRNQPEFDRLIEKIKREVKNRQL